MHLGNLYSALISWLSARKSGGKWILRIEDLDRQRCKEEYSKLLLSDLEWLGLSWDELYYQSERDAFYKEAFDSLCKKNLVYDCFCTRAELTSSAPHGKMPVYSGKCKNLSSEEKEKLLKQRLPSKRINVGEKTISFTDGHYGKTESKLSADCGDFVIRRADGNFSYQLAVVVDDADMGVTEVVRGRDLLFSTPQQLFLYDALNLSPPVFFHIPLILSSDGRRLSKRDKDCDMKFYRENSSPEKLIGKIMHLCSFTEKEEELSLGEALSLFDWGKLPKEDIRF